MITNADIAQKIDLLAKLMEIFGENSFKVKNYLFNASIIKKLPDQLSSKEIINAQEQIGAAVKNVIIELVETGTIAQLEQLIDKTPEGLIDLLKIKGLGPKKVAMLWKNYEISNLEQLESACLENRLITLKGFGVKTQEQILEQIAFIKNNNGWCLWMEGEKWMHTLSKWYTNRFGADEHLIAFVGGLAMQDPIINGLECIVTVDMDKLEAALMVDFGDEYLYENDGVSLTIINDKQVACTWMYVHSNEFYNKEFSLSSSNAFLNSIKNISKLPVNISSEIEIFEALGLPFIPAYLRGDDTLINYVLQNKSLPNIIAESDINGLIHCHSTWSDGLNSIKEMALHAISIGLDYMVITDHSKTAAYANGLTIENVKKQHKEIDTLNEALAPFKIFKGIESDILGDGNLDYDDEILASFDLIIASVHSNLNMSKEKATERILTAIKNPFTNMLGHPTGRLLLSRKGYELDMDAIINACKEHNVVIELNANPKRLDVDWQFLKQIQQAGVITSINPDAHSVGQISLTKYGVKVAQKAAVSPSNNLSSWPLSEIEQFIESQKAKRK